VRSARIDARAMIDTERHVHTCYICTPGLILTGPRLGDFHFGVRFGRNEARHLYVLFNGEPVGNVFEAIANHDGYMGRVWVYPNHRDHDDAKMVCCRTVPVDRDLARYGRDAHPCTVVLVGNVQIRNRQPDETIPWTFYRV
jgi:hypothetical protein